jgi:hypothetical protein
MSHKLIVPPACGWRRFVTYTVMCCFIMLLTVLLF